MYNADMRYDRQVKLDVQKLREIGCSVPEINKKTGVSKTTILRYIKNITIKPEFYQTWLDKKKTSIALRKRNIDLAEKKADNIIKSLDDKESAIIAAMLYWAEGSKKDFSLSNTDPQLIKTFLDSLKRVFHLNNEDFTISLRIYEDLNKEECLKYWSMVTGIKLDEHTSINILNGSKNGKLRYGMCRVRVKKAGQLHKTLFAICKKIILLTSPFSSMDRTGTS